ncbi:MAG TPA: hypothetical protein VFX76_12100, partial [Roseiflexaceae bacterium]|nr:hypothetical protein [Roseiflexaceae bacterium]
MTERSTTVDREKLLSVYERLLTVYGPRRLRAGGDPLGELIGTILSQNTSDVNSSRAFEQLRAAYPEWEDVLDAPLHELYEAIKSAGLGKIKAPRIQSALHTIL